MRVNLIDFNIAVGKHKPRTFQGMPNQSSCPFCDVKNLTGILATEGNIILLKNKYNVMEPSDQLVLIETDQCRSDIPEYSREHMRRLVRFGLSHWLTMVNSGDYQSVVFFKNFGPLSGGTLRHPHMQIIGFPKINPALMYEPEEFQGVPVITQNGVEVNISTQPRVGFTEINLNLTAAAYSSKVAFAEEKVQSPAPLPLPGAMDTLADYIQGAVAFLKEIHQRENFSYNLFFYIYQGRVHVRLMPRYPTSPLFIGYSIHLNPTNREQTAKQLREKLALI
ncbi:MAG: DUF4931 domain-containing protein [Anaerovibrio sp.]|nr:DUF4931 domain-containing protein [Anaerovibrio sp.]